MPSLRGGVSMWRGVTSLQASPRWVIYIVVSPVSPVTFDLLSLVPLVVWVLSSGAALWVATVIVTIARVILPGLPLVMMLGVRVGIREMDTGVWQGP